MSFLQKLTKVKKVTDLHHIGRLFLSFLRKSFRFFILLIALGMALFCIYIWYSAIYKSDWTEEQNQEYLKSKSQGVTFNKNIFDYVVSSIDARQQEKQRDIGSLSDIFSLKRDNQIVYPASNQE